MSLALAYTLFTAWSVMVFGWIAYSSGRENFAIRNILNIFPFQNSKIMSTSIPPFRSHTIIMSAIFDQLVRLKYTLEYIIR